MLPELPSLRFQPKFYRGGVSRFHLPLLYDLVALRKPAKIVVLGFGDGQPHFTFCQALRERDVAGRCLTIRREMAVEQSGDEKIWNETRGESEEFYGDLAALVTGSPVDLAAQEADGSVDILLVDDCDSAEIAQAELQAWRSKLAPTAVILWHGLEVERSPSPRTVFLELVRPENVAEFHDGIGLGVAFLKADATEEVAALTARAPLYQLIAQRIDAESRALEAEKKNAALELRQVWLGTLMEDRWKAQEIMDHQVRDRAQAQGVIDSQSALLKQWLRKAEALRGESKKLKAELKSALRACKKNGRCFGLALQEEKKRRSIPQRILRELRRIPANLSRSKPARAPAVPKKNAPKTRTDRYAAWILENEPDAAALDRRRRAFQTMTYRPGISLLLPIYHPPAAFLDELFASIIGQTYANFQVCAVDGGSDEATKKLLQSWQQKDARVRVEFLPENLGIAENTNRALALAGGQFVACIDQDDTLAPFALDELVRVIERNREGDIFYSDEDRLGVDGRRHSPFFKPEWSPEYLLSSMYLGHLTAYRRDLVDRIGGFRKEFDLSQDYDFALRATEQARAIYHVPHVLYHWREHPASGSAGGKPEARATNLAALAAAMERRGLAAEIMEYPTANRARLKIADWPRVSIIIPTDSPERSKSCLKNLPRTTAYPDYEIVLVTNSALVDSLESVVSDQPVIRFVRYDEPFNFSEKCNLGAQAASGSRLIFFNDDVESGQPDWIQNLIEPLENPAVGAVAPKLLYATGKIQHAGLVMGVRGLAGTACHQWPADSTEHHNFAQSTRDVAALSGACLATRRQDFFALGEFDAVNTPIAHSDIDLCFKIRAAEMRCVYTPFVTMTHRGHESIGAHEEEEKKTQRDKASIFLLKRWPRFTCHDPYFPDNMRDWLYTDSPTRIRMLAPEGPEAVGSSPDLLFVSHDLSLSGAPMMLLHAARWCRENGVFVVVMAPENGPLSAKFEAAGIPVIIDPLIETGHESFARFARDFDCVIANTILSRAVVRALKSENVPVAWWLHEPGSVGEHYIMEDVKIRETLPLPDVLFAPSERTAAIYRVFTDRPIKCLRNAIPDLSPNGIERGPASSRPLRFLLLGSIEPRKGQDVFVEALAMLPREVQEAAHFEIAGRILDPEFWPKVEAVGATLKNFSIRGTLSHPDAIAAMKAADVVISASRDEAMPTVTVLEAMCLGRALIATEVGGAREILDDGENALLVRPDAPEALATAIRRLIEEPALVSKLGEKARATYENNFTLERFGKEFRMLIDATISAGTSATPPAGTP